MWEDKTTVQKGIIGERIVQKHLEERGYVVYTPSTDGPHAFDKLAIRNKQEVIIAECKSKARRKFYPDTGIEVRHYNEYKFIEERHSIPVYLFFVDEIMKKVYGNELTILEQPRTVTFSRGNRTCKLNYPLKQGHIIYFPIEVMENVATLTETEATKLVSVSTRRYDYELCATCKGAGV